MYTYAEKFFPLLATNFVVPSLETRGSRFVATTNSMLDVYYLFDLNLATTFYRYCEAKLSDSHRYYDYLNWI
jgi:hypothetical protein